MQHLFLSTFFLQDIHTHTPSSNQYSTVPVYVNFQPLCHWYFTTSSHFIVKGCHRKWEYALSNTSQFFLYSLISKYFQLWGPVLNWCSMAHCFLPPWIHSLSINCKVKISFFSLSYRKANNGLQATRNLVKLLSLIKAVSFAIAASSFTFKTHSSIVGICSSFHLCA